MEYKLINGNSLDVLKTLEDNSIKDLTLLFNKSEETIRKIIYEEINRVIEEEMNELEAIKSILEGYGHYSLDPRMQLNPLQVFSDFFKKEQINNTEEFFKTIFSVELNQKARERFVFVIMYHKEALDLACLNYKLTNSLTTKDKTKINKI